METSWRTDLDTEENQREIRSQSNKRETPKTLNSEVEPTMEELWASHSLSVMENSQMLSGQVLQLQRANASLIETQSTLMQTIQRLNRMVAKQRVQMREQQRRFSSTLTQMSQTIGEQETQIEELHNFNNELILVQIGQLPNIPNLPESDGVTEVDWTSL